ncbi:fimbrial protein [Providencia rettgeri]|uniref:fimbrial protein n=1 Tax=Providencia rettgeri TaxID=587 RepID=UPI002572BAE3|nr:fimbrial protein [Providencia rettgeri]MDL9982726.1 fimbrial protein [Providencia rettgeri]
MIKKVTTLILSSVLMSPVVFSQTTANIKVSGVVKMPTCLINGNEQSDIIFELAKTSPRYLNQTSYTILQSPVRKNVTVICDAETYLTYRTTDTYQNTPWSLGYTDDYFFMVYSGNPDKSVGAVMFTVSDITIDSKTAFIASDGFTANNIVMRKKILNGFGTKSSSVFANKLTAGKVFSADFLTNSVYISSINQLTSAGIDLTSNVDYQAEAVLAFNFGI